MWRRALQFLRCPLCLQLLELSPFREGAISVTDEHRALARQRELLTDDFDRYVDVGVLLCTPCAAAFPIVGGVPVLLPYVIPVHQRFAHEFRAELERVPGRHAWPARPPLAGEVSTATSFSVEWSDYDFDGVIWEMDYPDHEERFLSEVTHASTPVQSPFLEVGCGIGVTTFMAHRAFGVDAVGVDLSTAAARAAVTYRSNPFLHFVQASLFSLPFAPATFGTVYSRGVLHHTFSTRAAFDRVAGTCRPGGLLYVWLYGPRSIRDNVFRYAVYLAERLGRRLLRGRSARTSAVALAPVAAAYMVFNALRRRRNPRIQPYTFRRALHAARDRFTPEFAHRHSDAEVAAWFRSASFEDVEVVDWRTMPAVDHDDYRRNTGVRGRRRADIDHPQNESTSCAAFTAPSA